MCQAPADARRDRRRRPDRLPRAHRHGQRRRARRRPTSRAADSSGPPRKPSAGSATRSSGPISWRPSQVCARCARARAARAQPASRACSRRRRDGRQGPERAGQRRGPADEPQIGNVGDYRRGLQIVRTPVALHVEFPGTSAATATRSRSSARSRSCARASSTRSTSSSLAQRYERVEDAAPRARTTIRRSTRCSRRSPARMPVAFEADLAREILRALDMAQEFKLDPIITGGREADQVAADLKARNARVIYSLNFPTRPRTLAPDADEPVRELRARAHAPKVPAALEKAGVHVRVLLVRPARAARLRPQRRPRGQGRPARRCGAARADDRRGEDRRRRRPRRLAREEARSPTSSSPTATCSRRRPRIRHVFVDGRSVTVEEAQPEGRRGRAGQ